MFEHFNHYADLLMTGRIVERQIKNWKGRGMTYIRFSTEDGRDSVLEYCRCRCLETAVVRKGEHDMIAIEFVPGSLEKEWDARPVVIKEKPGGRNLRGACDQEAQSGADRPIYGSLTPNEASTPLTQLLIA